MFEKNMEILSLICQWKFRKEGSQVLSGKTVQEKVRRSS